jgi:TrmH family RNA methyltransferase
MTRYPTPQGLIAMIGRARSPRGRRRAGVYSIEGLRLVERALRAGAPLEAVLMARRLADSVEPRHLVLSEALRAAGCPITVVDDEVLAELTEGRDLGPILGLVRLPPPMTLSELLADAQSPLNPFSASPPLFLCAIHIVDPGNVGALTRTGHAAGARALLTSGSSDAFHPRATRIGRGSIFKLPVRHYDTAAALLADLRGHGVALVGTSAAGGIAPDALEWPPRATAVLMGNEAEGLPVETQAVVDYNVTIPMPDGVDSYSVNAAAAIILYTARTARRTQ